MKYITIIIDMKNLKNIGLEDEEILRAVISHHEKEDGKGYPYGLKAEEIPLFAKLFKVSFVGYQVGFNDIWDTLPSPKGLSIFFFAVETI